MQAHGAASSEGRWSAAFDRRTSDSDLGGHLRPFGSDVFVVTQPNQRLVLNGHFVMGLLISDEQGSFFSLIRAC